MATTHMMSNIIINLLDPRVHKAQNSLLHSANTEVIATSYECSYQPHSHVLAKRCIKQIAHSKFHQCHNSELHTRAQL